MENLKIKLNSADESKEAQELFFKLGASWCFGCHINHNLPHERDFILHNFGSQLFWAHTYESKNYDDAKEITMPEFRAMVNPMKEYINKTTGEYRKTSDVVSGEQWVEVPEGGNVAYKDPNDGSIYFTRLEMGYRDVELLWNRAAKPESLPFVDDDPKYTDDEVKYMDENGQGRLQSINDQYAEIEQVRQQTIEATLAERQSTYGNFEDVAFVTENIMATLSKVRTNGLSDLPHTHRMALYMIASKMARIVCGDCNSIDGWHDIAGYATLVERLIGDQSDV